VRLSPDFLAKRRAKRNRAASASAEPAPVVFKRRILNDRNFDPDKQINVGEVISRILALAQALSEKKFYPYQIKLARRLVESVLLHDGSVITGLMARQIGKTEIIAALCAALALILPFLAKQFPESWHLNITDDYGTYRGFVFGFKIGIYAPRLLQSEIMFERVRKCYETKTAQQVLKEMHVHSEVNNGNRLILTNGSVTLCDSASEQSKIEGETHNLLIAEEAQDIADHKVKKSLHPMVSSTMGTICKIGTATTFKCDFYTSIKTNERMELATGVQSHFFFPYTVGEKYNSLYRKYIEQEKIRLGEDSDEFRTSYCGEWIFERGMFITSQQLFDQEVALTFGLFSEIYLQGLPEQYSYYSIVAGIDWGSSNDSTVVTLSAVNWNSPLQSGEYYRGARLDSFVFYKKHVLGWIEYRGDNYEIQFWALFEYFKMLSKRGLRKIVMDSNTCGKPIFDRFQSVMIPYNVEVVSFNFSPKVKSDGYRFYYSDICGHRVTFPAGIKSRQTREYRNFAFQMLDLKKTYHLGLMSVSHPDEKGAHDDYPDSAMMSVLGANTPAHTSELEFSGRNIILGD
jgi:hypothetical protein